MPERLIELRLVVAAEDDILPEIVLDDFIADLRSHWRIEELDARAVPAEKETQ